MPYNVEQVFLGAAALLNDGNRDVYTNDVQTPYFKIAYQELRQELEQYNVPCVNQTSASIVVNAGVHDIGGNEGPPLPIDLIDPLVLWERTHGTTDDFLQMQRFTFLPKTELETPFLRVWSLQKRSIRFLGATSNLDVKIDYVCDPLIDFVNENTQIVVFNTENFLKYRTAALCANFIGENPSRAQLLDQMAVPEMETLLNIVVKSMQSIPTRRRPFRAARKTTGWGSNGW